MRFNEFKLKEKVEQPLGNPSQQPAKVVSKDRAENADIKIGPPYPPELYSRVKDMQTKLEKVGYSVGPTGIDGKFGPNTSAALGAFIKDYKVHGDSKNFSKEAEETLDKVLSGVIPKVEKPSQTGATGNAVGGVGETGSAKEAIQFFISKGWTPAQAAGIVGNLQAESGANLKTNAVGDGGKAYGIAQWHPDRQANFSKAFGKDIRDAGFKEQLAFVQWELENSEKNAANMLRQAKTPEDAAYLFDKYYERSSGAHRQRRIDNALALAPLTTSTTRFA